jgi:hypothetical protein
VSAVTLKIANAAGFLGDNLDAPRRLIQAAEVDYLTLEYLAELTLSILARVREKNPRAGFAGDFLTVLESIAPALQVQSQLQIVTNAGGMNPRSCAARAAELLAGADLEHLSIGVVSGDDLFGSLDRLRQAGCQFENLDTGQPLCELKQPIVSANAYLGAQPIATALDEGARIVITGRVADASLTLGPAVHEFGWKWDDWDRLAGGSVAGHLIECGAQVTGGLYRHWQELHLSDVGYPIAEIARDASATITKPARSGGQVSRETVIEQLVYEIGDPAHYLTPDVDVDFTTVEVDEVALDRVSVRGATGRKAPANYKVSLAYHAGYAASGQLLVYGRDAVSKAQECAGFIEARLLQAGFQLDELNVECLGTGDGVPGRQTAQAGAREVLLRIAVQDSRAAAVERFTKEFAPLITSGPPGLAGYAAPRGAVRPVYAYWPTLVPRELVDAHVQVCPARRWASGEM